MNQNRNGSRSKGDRVAKGRQTDICLQFDFKFYDVGIDEGIDPWVEHEVSNVDVGKDDLIKKPREVFQKAKDLPEMGRADLLLVKEKVT